MRSLILFSAAAMTVASCTPTAAPNDAAALAQETAGRVAGKPQSCISTMQSQNLRVINGQTLAYDQGATIWINRLAARCPGIEPLSTVIVEPKLGTQYCRGDHIRGRELGANIPGPTCFLNDWVPYRRP